MVGGIIFRSFDPLFFFSSFLQSEWNGSDLGFKSDPLALTSTRGGSTVIWSWLVAEGPLSFGWGPARGSAAHLPAENAAP